MLDDIEIGSHIVSPRTGYYHHGIYVGDGNVVHYLGLCDDISNGPVSESTLAEFCSGNGYSIKKHTNAKFDNTEIVRRARSRIGEDLYCVFSNNCEHFCEWCINNDHDSVQVTTGTSIASPTSGTTVGLIARGVVSAGGVVTGLSGPGIMSGLASAGGLVGGGAVAGIGVLGAGPGIAMASLVNKTILKDTPTLDEDERDSRAIGRAASYVGVAGGTAGGIAAVSTLGTAGLSGAGISSGLAALGGTIGGGMASGVVIATAAPVAAAVAVGYGVYKIAKWVRRL